MRGSPVRVRPVAQRTMRVCQNDLAHPLALAFLGRVIGFDCFCLNDNGGVIALDVLVNKLV